MRVPGVRSLAWCACLAQALSCGEASDDGPGRDACTVDSGAERPDAAADSGGTTAAGTSAQAGRGPVGGTIPGAGAGSSAGTQAAGSRDAATDGPADGGTQGPGPLSAAYPDDIGLGSDPAVLWFEAFEAASTDQIAARYDQVRDNGRFTLVDDTPNGRGTALAMRAGGGEPAVDLYKQLPDANEWFVRWYAKYEAGVPWHHSGMWFGGYRPAMAYPSPMAGNRPAGDDRFSIAVEPVYGLDSPSPRFDFYNYWMGMHSWMAAPIQDDGSAYYGNALVHRNDFTVDEGRWNCLEVHVRLNTSADSGAGAQLEVWKNDTLVASFDDASPQGYWIRDKFCPEGADGSECTDYPAPADEVLSLRFRNTPELKLNAFWPQNYITDDGMGTLTFDQMVVAEQRVGCMR